MTTALDLRDAHPRYWRMASALRALAMDAVQKANSGHPGMPMGMADVAAVLFDKHLNFDPADANWPDRDRFVLSAGHGSMLLYGLLHLTGYPEISMEEIRNFRQWGARTAGHPEYGHAAGIETTTGPLGQGIATAVGMALAERMAAARYGDKLVNHRTWVIAGDGCLMEGISQEAIALAGHLKLNKLVVLWDDNNISIDGQINLSDSTDQLARFAASGWNTLRINGHDYDAIDAALTAAKASDKPTLIACKTVIGFGAPTKQGTAAVHGAPLGADEVAATRKAIGWTHDPFVIPQEIYADWRMGAARGAAARAEWGARLAKAPAKIRNEFIRTLSGTLPKTLAKAMKAYKDKLLVDRPKVATRKASEMALAVINAEVPEMVGGSADLTHSNLTITKGQVGVKPGDYAGSYVYYGIREHGMAAAMNGIALHGGFIPYGGTFMVFTDYARGAIRLSALMGQRVIYVMTHDSIGLGEDGPTHQPIEHLAMLRATPNLLVLRPADALETAEAWEIAVNNVQGPTVLVLSRQNLPMLRVDAKKNLSAQGAYVLAEADQRRRVVLIATGSELEIAVAAKSLLEREGIGTRVVSMPSWELFAQQDEKTRQKVLGGRGMVRIAIEAASRLGWDRWLAGEGGDDRKSAFIGMTGFGASAPGPELYKQFGLTAEAVATKAKSLL